MGHHIIIIWLISEKKKQRSRTIKLSLNVRFYELCGTLPPLWYPYENVTELPSLFILVVPDSVKQFVTYSNLQ